MKRAFNKNWEYLLVGLIGIITLGFFALGINFQTSRADSGWDSDYDSGGSWSSSDSSWSSSDWSSSSSSWSSSSGSHYSDDLTDLIVMMFIIIIILVLINASSKTTSRRYTTSYTKKSYNPYKNKSLNTRPDISNEEIQMYLPEENLGSLKHMAFNKFVAIQNAWMDFDYEMLRVLCTDELYNSYVSQLNTLKIKFGKNIMKQFHQDEIRVLSVKKENNLVTVKIYLCVTFYDYVINEKNNNVIRGSKNYMITNKYELEFVRKAKTDNGIVKCPNCSSEIHIVTSKNCPYCGTTIVVDPNEFVLSKKKIVK